MSWRAVARKDYQDAVRSGWLWALSIFFVLLVAGAAYVIRPGQGGQLSSNAVLGALNGFFITTFVPLIAIVIAYGAIVGERDTGSLKLLLSLPHSRADVVFGKVVGRAAALATPIAVGFLLPAVVFLIGPVQFDVLTYLGFTLLSVFLGLVFVAIAVGLSASSGSQRIVMAASIAFYFVFVPLWGAIQLPLQFYLLMGGGPGWLPVGPQSVFRALRLINPTGSFKIVSGALLSDQLFAGGSLNLQLAALGMLLVWLLVPPLLGYWSFDSADL